MGVLNDYFRARDDHEAARVTSHMGGPLRPGDDGHPAFDGVEAKGMDHTVVLGQLVALLRGVPWTPALCGSRLVEGACVDLEEGPWVVVIDDDIRDDLAAISPAALPALAERWTGIDELRGPSLPRSSRCSRSSLPSRAAHARPESTCTSGARSSGEDASGALVHSAAKIDRVDRQV